MNGVYETHSSGGALGLYSAPALRVWPDRDKKLGIASSGMKKMIIPAKAGFQRESLCWKYECVTNNNNNNNHENKIGEMQKAADRHRPDHHHNFFLSS